MAQLTTSAIVRGILKANSKLTNDEVVQRAKAQGATVAEAKIREAIYNVRSDMKKAAAKAALAPAAARTTAKAPAPAAAAKPAAKPATKPAVTQPVAAATNLKSVLANVAQVNAAVSGAGGVDAARKVAEAVRSCGGVDAFLLHLNLVAGIRTDAS